jgi:hypothetical protein
MVTLRNNKETGDGLSYKSFVVNFFLIATDANVVIDVDGIITHVITKLPDDMEVY